MYIRIICLHMDYIKKKSLNIHHYQGVGIGESNLYSRDCRYDLLIRVEVLFQCQCDSFKVGERNVIHANVV